MTSLMRSKILTALKQFFADVPPEATIGVAVSGGSDSVAMLLALREALPVAKLRAATVNHGLRAEAAAEDVKPVVDDQVPDLPLTSPKDSRKKSLQAGKRRVGVSAEATNETPRSYVKTVIEKSPEVKTRIQEATATNALFAGLGSEQHTAVIDAMFEMQCAASPRIYAHLLSPPHPRVPPHTSSRHLPHATSSRHLPHPCQVHGGSGRDHAGGRR